MSAAPIRNALRHFFAWVATTAAWLLLWTVAYLLLLVWAMITNEGIGSPVVWPLGLLMIFLIHTGATLVIFLPVSLFSELICVRKKLPKVRAGLAITFGLFLLFNALISGVIILLGGSEAPDYLETVLSLILGLALPMGAYWWASRFPSLLRIAFEKIHRKIRS